MCSISLEKQDALTLINGNIFRGISLAIDYYYIIFCKKKNFLEPVKSYFCTHFEKFQAEYCIS